MKMDPRRTAATGVSQMATARARQMAIARALGMATARASLGIRAVTLLVAGAFWLPALLQCGCGRAPRPAEMPPRSSDHVRLSLTAGSGPDGASSYVGVRFDIEPGWHLYSLLHNDSGLPPEIRLTPPPGFSIGPALWPAPRRHVAEGDILDHVFEDTLVVLYKVTPKAGSNTSGGRAQGAEAGSADRWHVDADWLVCKDACLPGGAEAEARFSLEAWAGSRDDTPPLAKETFRRLPHPGLPDGAMVKELPVPGGPAPAHEAERVWLVRVPGARALAFMPDTACALLAHPIADAAAAADSLRLRVRNQERVPGVIIAGLSGILEVTNEAGTRWYQLPPTGTDTGKEPQ